MNDAINFAWLCDKCGAKLDRSGACRPLFEMWGPHIRFKMVGCEACDKVESLMPYPVPIKNLASIR
jgi:hypothetical protein